MQNANPPNSAVYTPDPSSVNYWLELTTAVEGDDASATDHIVRIAIEDDFNGGAAIGEYPDYIPDCVEAAGFNSVTHTVGNDYSFPTGGLIRSQSTADGWTLAQGGGSSNTASTARLTFTNNAGSAIDLRMDVLIFQ